MSSIDRTNSCNFYYTYRDHFVLTRFPHIFTPLKFLGEFGNSTLDLEGLKGRVNRLEQLKVIIVIASIVNLLMVRFLLDQCNLSVFIMNLLVFLFIYCNLEISSSKKLMEIERIVSSADNETVVNTLLETEPILLQKCWDRGLIRKELLEFTCEVVNDLGKELCSQKYDQYSEQWSRLMFYLIRR